MRTEELLQQSQSLTQELQSQSEELQSQQEELRRSNAELEDQARSLKASEELLQAQQEELQQTNAELEEKARLLSQQNRDIEIKNREIELARAGLEDKAAQLALSSKYKSEFLANMSHELRTPLNSLLILARLLSDDSDQNLTQKQIEFARTIYSSGSDLLNLINDILDLSKVEAGKMDVNPSPVEVSNVSDYVERSFRPVAEQKGLEFAFEVGESVPTTIVTDEQRLQQILKNLLSNAFKFTEHGRVTLCVQDAPEGLVFDHPGLRAAERVVAFSVTDTGIGVAPEKLRLIFEAFQQADGTTSRRYGGTGLGLSISREIARLLGGELRADSTPGVGSTFTLFLPDDYRPQPGDGDGEDAIDAIARLMAPSVAAAVPEGGEGGEGGDGPELLNGEASAAMGRLTALPTLAPEDVDEPGERFAAHDPQPGDRVLLVVAEEGATASDIARRQGFKVMAAEDPDGAVALARDLNPDAVLVDVGPGAEGLAVLSALKGQPETRHIPVHIALPVDHRHEALRAGAAGLIDHPVTEQALEQSVRSMVQFISRDTKQVLVVEDDETQRSSIEALIGGGDDVDIVGVGSSEEALALLGERRFDCMVLDLKLPDMTGFALLEKIKKDLQLGDLPIIVYTGKELTRREETRLKKYAETIIIKDASSPDRLLAETSLFLHRPAVTLPASQRRMLQNAHAGDAVLQGKRVLVIDDDVRNVFALTSALESSGMEVLFAENGRDGIDVLEQNAGIDIVLMDIMMPEMDGYETTRAIRRMEQFARLPIIALTAKAMKGDREKSIASGASDYITKPVDLEQLLSLMRVWLYQ